VVTRNGSCASSTAYAASTCSARSSSAAALPWDQERHGDHGGLADLRGRGQARADQADGRELRSEAVAGEGDQHLGPGTAASSAISPVVSASATGTQVAPAYASRACAGERCSLRNGPYAGVPSAAGTQRWSSRVTVASGRPSGSTSSITDSPASASGTASVTGDPGSSYAVSGASAPERSSSRSSSSRGVGQCWGAAGLQGWTRPPSSHAARRQPADIGEQRLLGARAARLQAMASSARESVFSLF
jgi:hypothetical protein